MKQYVVVDVGGTFTKYVLMDEGGCLLHRFEKIPTEKESPQKFIVMLEKLFAQAQIKAAPQKISGMAISAPGMIDSNKGVMHTGGTIFSIHELPLTAELEKIFCCPVTVENDARCAILAEAWQGVLKNCKTGIVLILGTAVGGGVLQEQHLLCGKHGIAGEFSYIMTANDEHLCEKNFLGRYCGVPALVALTAKKKQLSEDELSSEKIFERALSGDKDYQQCIRDYAHRIAQQIMNLQMVIDPDCFAIGGGISSQPLLLELIREELSLLAGSYPHPMPVPEVNACRFRNDANLIGALFHHLRRMEKSNEE